MKCNGKAQICVEDNGPGIADEMKPYIFEMFYTGKSTIADSQRSLGLGLSLCQSIIEAHDGRLILTDNTPRGCIFTFTLPLSEVTLNKTVVLVVEDDRPIRNLIVTTLKMHDYKYLTAKNGASAIMEASSHHPDIVLLDLGLPDMEGVDVIKKIRTWSNMPIIVISARSEDSDKIEALDSGADDYITKPFSVEELLARIRVTQRRLAIIQAGEEQEVSIFINGQLKIDYTAGCTYLKGKELHLTPIEYKLLCLLSRNVGKVLTHTYITQQIWGNCSQNDVASLRVFMATLRKKLEPDKNGLQYIQTHIGIGYRMLRIE